MVNMIMKYGYIYLTTCLVDGLKYIGKHKGLPSSRYIGSGTLFLEHVRKHGRANFKHDVLEWASDEQALRLLEERYLCNVNAAANPEYLNVTNRSAGIATHSETARHQISEASKRNWNDPEVKKRWIASRKKLWKENDVMGARSEKQSSTMSSVMKSVWADPEKRKQMMAFIDERRRPKLPEENFNKNQKRLLRIARQGHLLQISTPNETILGSQRMIAERFGIKRYEVSEHITMNGWSVQNLSAEAFMKIQLDA